MTNYRFGEFEFRCESRMLLHSNAERHLSPKAYQLLRVLLAARPRAVSREELYDELWPTTFVSESNLASVVNEVRRALDDDSRSPHYIRTVHGYGYAFCGGTSIVEEIASKPAAVGLFWEGRRYPLSEGENSIGREVDNEVVLIDSTVSRHHAAIVIANGVVSVRDLESTNGTFVDGVRIGATPVALRDGSRLELGAACMQLHWRRVSSTQRMVAQRAAEG